MRVLTWNLFHGRSLPDTPRSLRAEFAAALAAWEWDVALLQEVPPWWPPQLARATGADARTALTSRNALLALRRALAEWRPDLLKSNGGGANAILVRGMTIREHRVRRLRRWPERRVVHGVRLDSGIWVSNVHAQGRSPSRARADLAAAAAQTIAWAGAGPAVLGGDLNMRQPAADGFVAAGGHRVDHVLARGLRPVGATEVLDRRSLSDHEPVVVELTCGNTEPARKDPRRQASR